MKILLVSDKEAEYYYDYYRPGRLDSFDLILACGDLNAKYLEFLATLASCPVLYVHGNHDDSLVSNPPGGCICIENQIYNFKGIRILGLGGSYRYRDGMNMYTERQMKKRILKMRYQLWKNKGFDILLTHAPAYGINDLDNISHRGFECFRDLLSRYKPRYFIHGHVHQNYDYRLPRRQMYHGTEIINAYEYYHLEYEES